MVIAEEAIVRRDGAFVVLVPLVRADFLDFQVIVVVVGHLRVVVVGRLSVQAVVLDL